MDQVKRALLALNELNGHWPLFETSQREILCDLFGAAAQRAGLETDEDVTLEWRDW